MSVKQRLTLFLLLLAGFSVQAQVTPTTQTATSTQTETTVRNGIGRIGLEQPMKTWCCVSI